MDGDRGTVCTFDPLIEKRHHGAAVMGDNLDALESLKDAAEQPTGHGGCGLRGPSEDMVYIVL